MEKRKKLLSAILSVSMIASAFTALPLSASAEGEQNSGEEVTATVSPSTTAGVTTTGEPVATATTEVESTDEPATVATPEATGVVYEDQKIKITNAKADKVTIVISKYYDNKTLAGVELKENVTLENGSGEVAYDLQGKAAKIMVWDDIKTMTPLFATTSVEGTVDPAPTLKPTEAPSTKPSTKPTAEPSTEPTAEPSAKPSTEPTAEPSTEPSTEPTAEPSAKPSSYIYERGINTAWSAADLSDWKLTGNAASPVIDATHGLYVDTNQTGYVTKEISLSDNAVVTYNAKFYTENSTGRTSNYAYLKFGSNVTVGYNSNYKLYYSIDGGTTYNTEELKSSKGATTDIKVVINTSANTLVSLSIDGKEVTSAANLSLGTDATYNSISMGFLRAGSVNWNTLYGLVSIGVTEVIDATVYHTVRYSVDGKTSTEAVADGETVAEIPNTDKLGYTFKGWKINNSETLISTEELKALPITVETEAEAVYEYDSDYARNIQSVEFVSPITTAIQYPAEAGAVETKPYTVKVVADTGEDITNDCTFAWDIVGNESDDGYCKMDETATTSTNNLEIKQGGASNFGYIKVTATYTKNTEAKTVSAQTPFAVISNVKVANQILPATGYPVSMDDLSDNLVGYVGTENTYSKYDIVLNNWCIVGSNPARDYLLVKDEAANKKAVKITNLGGNRDGNRSTTVGTMAFPAQSEQYVFETIAKFEGDNGRIGVWDKTSNNDNASAEWSFTYSSNAITAGDEKITGLSSSEWYKVIVASDPVNDLYSVYVYDLNGTLKGSIEGIAGGTKTPKFLCVDKGFPVYINSLRAYIPTVDQISITSDTNVVKVPETETYMIQELHLPIYHCWCLMLEDHFFGENQ